MEAHILAQNIPLPLSPPVHPTTLEYQADVSPTIDLLVSDQDAQPVDSSTQSESALVTEEKEQPAVLEDESHQVSHHHIDAAPVHPAEVNGKAGAQNAIELTLPSPPTPPSKPLPSAETLEQSQSTVYSSPISPAETSTRPPTNGHHDPPLQISVTESLTTLVHKRSMTISKGHTVSIVLISTALETIAASKEAKRSASLRESTHLALELVRSGLGGDRPREVFEPLRQACETRNEKLMIASLDCISKLISYSFFAESTPLSSQTIPSPPPSPHSHGRNSTAGASQATISQPSLVDIVAHTITSCHTETTPETVSLQIVKALLSLILSPTILVHHSSLLKAVRTVYNVFLLSVDPVNQMVAQGGLTQMVHHVFTRCKIGAGVMSSVDSATPRSPRSQESLASPGNGTFSLPTPEPGTLSHVNGHADGGSANQDATASESSASLPLPAKDESLSPRSTEAQGGSQPRITLYAAFN